MRVGSPIVVTLGVAGALLFGGVAPESLAAQGRGGGLLYGERGLANALNPYGAQRDPFSGRVMSMLYEPLLRYDFGVNEWENVLIESYEADGLTATVRLKDGVAWHDGETLTADDVVFTYSYIRDHSTNEQEKTTYLQNMAGPPVAIDDRTVQFTFTDSYGGDGRVYLEKPIIPSHVFDGAVPLPGQRLDQQPLGTGPYRFQNFTANRNPVLRLFEEYHLQPGYLEEVQAERWTDAATVVGMLTTSKFQGGLDLIVELPVGTSVALREGYEQVVSVRQQESYRMIAISLRQNPGSPLADVRVRQALTHAINRAELLSTFYEGAGEVLASAWVPSAPNFDPAIEPLAYDTDRARSLLTEAGVTQGSLTMIYPVSSHSDDQRRQQTATAIRDALRPLGITLTLQALEPSVYNERVDFTRDWDMAWIEWEFDPTYAVGQLFHSSQTMTSGGNSMAFASPEVDSQLERYELAVIDARRKRSISSTLQTLLRDQAPMLFLFSQRNVFAHKVEVSIPSLPDPFHFFADIKTWEYIR